MSLEKFVMPRKRHVSRNLYDYPMSPFLQVMPRKRHVSRNFACEVGNIEEELSCLARGM